MTISGSTLHQMLKPMLSVVPAAHGAGTVNGTGVATSDYRRAQVILAMGAMAATATLNTKIQYRDLDGNWNDLLQDDGVGAVAFAEQDGDADNTLLVGELYLTEFPEHDQIRAVSVVANDTAAHSVLIVLGDKYELPTGVTNAFETQHGVGARPVSA